jgi:hypothetical protein
VTFILSEKLSGRSAPAAALAHHPSSIMKKKKVLPPLHEAPLWVSQKERLV